MAQDIVIGGTVYPDTESVAMRTAEGDTVQFYPDAVRYAAQELTEEQKAQARANIGAIAAGSESDSNRVELIEEITLTEDTSAIVREVLPDGTPYGYKSILAMFAQNQTWSNKWIKIEAFYDKNLYGACPYVNNGGVKAANYSAFKSLTLSGPASLAIHAGIQEANGIITSIFTYGGSSPSNLGATIASVGSEIAYNVNNAKIIKFAITSEVPLVADTRIFLFGVRA